MTHYEWAITRQVRWLILLLLVILTAILVFHVGFSEQWMRFKEEFWTGDRVVVAMSRRDREAALTLLYLRRMHQRLAVLERGIQLSKGVCNLIINSVKPSELHEVSRVIDCARAHGIPVPPLNPTWPYEAWRDTVKIVCERKSPACPRWRRVLSNVGIVTW
ncbi:MAG: hypothetical protein OXN89_05055 [Bryobacterales bacterium]|nr:hypothetical protein [Bryobacterales bacterium]